jgi:hypothetical protein
MQNYFWMLLGGCKVATLLCAGCSTAGVRDRVFKNVAQVLLVDAEVFPIDAHLFLNDAVLFLNAAKLMLNCFYMLWHVLLPQQCGKCVCN